MLCSYGKRIEVIFVVFSFYFGGVFDITIMPFTLVEYEIILAKSTLRASLPLLYPISNASTWNNC